MRSDESLQPREAEHLTLGVVSLDQAIAVEKDAVALLQHSLLLLVEHAGHKPKGHPPSPKLRGVAGSPLVTQVVAITRAAGTPLSVTSPTTRPRWPSSSSRKS